MSQDNFDLAALLGSRICHDLISPLGAVSNGLELLAMTGQPNSPEFKLIADSIENANSKIRFFRVAYGTAAQGVTLARPEIASILDDNYKGTRLTVVWNPVHEIQRRDVRISFLAIQCLESAMPYGGQIEISAERGGFRAIATAEKMKLHPEYWAMLTNGGQNVTLTASQVQFGLLGYITRWRKPSLKAMITDGQIVLTF